MLAMLTVPVNTGLFENTNNLMGSEGPQHQQQKHKDNNFYFETRVIL